MLTILIMKMFIKNYNQPDTPAVREKCGTLSGAFGIVINLFLSVSKFLVGGLTGSVAITADALNNLTDCLTSILTILGFKWSAKAADKEHPFGHARIEYLISLAVAAIILVTGYEVMRSSVSAIIAPEPLNFSVWIIVVLVASMVGKFWMYIFNRKLGQLVKSDTLLAVGIDSRNDVIINAATLVALVVAQVTGFNIDGFVGVMLALVFFRAGYQVAREALSRIIGNRAERDMAAEIKAIVKSQPQVLGMHGLVVHNYGPGRDMSSLHVEIPMDISLYDSHKIVEKIAYEVQEKLGIPLVIQLDPIDVADERLQDVMRLTREYVNKKCPAIYANEFRIISAIPRPKLVFDLEFPLEYKKKANEMRDTVAEGMKEIVPEYDCEINVEFSFVE